MIVPFGAFSAAFPAAFRCQRTAELSRKHSRILDFQTGILRAGVNRRFAALGESRLPAIHIVDQQQVGFQLSCETDSGLLSFMDFRDGFDHGGGLNF